MSMILSLTAKQKIAILQYSGRVDGCAAVECEVCALGGKQPCLLVHLNIQNMKEPSELLNWGQRVRDTCQKYIVEFPDVFITVLDDLTEDIL